MRVNKKKKKEKISIQKSLNYSTQFDFSMDISAIQINYLSIFDTWIFILEVKCTRSKKRVAAGHLLNNISHGD